MFGGRGLTRLSKACAAHAPCAPRRPTHRRGKRRAFGRGRKKAWSRVHMDYLGPLFGKLYLVMVDAGSKWLEVFEVPSTAAQHAIARLSETFARWGIPKQIVSDNGPPYTSVELDTYLSKEGVEHIFAAPYHPSSNGAAENGVRTVKRVIRKAVRQNININIALNKFLLYYRNTEHCSTGVSPAALMLGRQVRTKLDALRPDCESKVRVAQKRQERNSGGTSDRAFEPGQQVWVRQYQGGTKWVPGEVAQKLGSRDYRVLDEQGRSAHRHSDQLRQRLRNSLVCPGSPSPQGSRPSLEEKVPPAMAASPEGTRSWKADSTPQAPRIDPNIESSGAIVPRDEVSELRVSSGESNPPDALPFPGRPVRQCRLDNPPRYKV